MTRHAYQEEIRRVPSGDEKKDKDKPVTNGVTSHHTDRKRHNSGDREVRRRESLRSSARHSTEVPQSIVAPVVPAHKPATAGLSDRVTPPPPILIPSVINNKQEGSSRCSTPTLPDGAISDKEGALNGVLSWKLIGDDCYYDRCPTPPSILYGAPHLLRLCGQ